jgi:hypothetical protein
MNNLNMSIDDKFKNLCIDGNGKLKDWLHRLAAKYGNLAYLKYLNESTNYPDASDVDNIEKLPELTSDWKKNTCTIVAKNGHLECLKYLHEQGFSWDKHTFIKAVSNGHLKCLIYLHENDCPWDKEACEYAYSEAIKNNHLNILKYLLENQYPINIQIYEKCENMFKNETWFLIYIRTWLYNAYNPNTTIGYMKMQNALSSANTYIDMLQINEA